MIMVYSCNIYYRQKYQHLLDLYNDLQSNEVDDTSDENVGDEYPVDENDGTEEIGRIVKRTPGL